jgi:tetratricopeptide (TPR) repeat protein
MFRKNYFTFLLAAVLFLVGGVVAFGQTAPVSGRVILKKADGSTAPVAGVLVEVFREDNKATYPTDKTGKKGDFAFAGLPMGYKYILVVSGPGIAPLIYPGVPAGADNFTITVSEGDGKRMTEQEVRDTLAQSKSNGLVGDTTSNEQTEEAKKAQAELEKKKAEVENKNKGINERNALRDAAVKEGAAALEAKNYDLAITKFDEGYKVDTEFLGSAPFFLTAKGKALSNRGVDRFNKANKLTDPTEKMNAMGAVTKDFSDAVDAFNTSYTMVKNASPTSGADPKRLEVDRLDALSALKNVVVYMIATEKVDNTKLPLIKTLLTEYMSVETDAAKKVQAQVNLADIYRIAADSDNAISEYRKALEMSPDNPDALAGLGLSLFNSGEINNNVAQKQEGLGYMERFIEVAPDTHKLKASVADAVAYLKSQKITPQKVTTKKKN